MLVIGMHFYILKLLDVFDNNRSLRVWSNCKRIFRNLNQFYTVGKTYKTN